MEDWWTHEAACALLQVITGIIIIMMVSIAFRFRKQKALSGGGHHEKSSSAALQPRDLPTTRPDEVDAPRLQLTRSADALPPRLQLTRPDEVDAMQSLRQQLAQELASMPPYEDLRGERRLLRFLRGNGTVQAAAQAFRQQLLWRSKERVDEIRKTVDPLPWSMTAHPELAVECKKIFNILPFHMDECLRTPEGHIVWLELPARLNLRAANQMPDEEFKRTWFSLMELRSRVLDEMSVKQQRLIKVVQIRDLKGLTASFYFSIVRNARLLARIKTVIKTSMGGHPESIDTAWLLNVPRFFPTVYALFSSLLNDNMKRKLRIVPFPHNLQVLVDVGGLDVLLAMTRLAAETLSCPGSGRTSVEAGNFLDLAVRMSAGNELRWDWNASDLEFSVTEFAEPTEAAESSNVVAAARMDMHSGIHVARRNSVCVFRWSNIHAWSSARSMSYSISLQNESEGHSLPPGTIATAVKPRQTGVSCCSCVPRVFSIRSCLSGR
mmetsp:Transcript_54719/g.97174  ORF Transcript_54719/g.97174 Transcript_54719/m.97174 type:complete len:494 (+) Transcript_54719:47-1528(+)